MTKINEILNKHLKINNYQKGNRHIAIFFIGLILIGIGLTHITKILNNKESLSPSFKCKKCKNNTTGVVVYKKDCSNSPNNPETYQEADTDAIKMYDTMFCGQQL